MTYIPTIVNSPPGSYEIQPGDYRPKRFITNAQLPVSPRIIDAGMVQFHGTHEPDGPQWQNSVRTLTVPHGTLDAGYEARDYTYLDDDIKRYAFDFNKYRLERGTNAYIYYGNTATHPLYNAGSFGISVLFKPTTLAIEQRFLTVSLATLPALLFGTGSAANNKFRVFMYQGASNYIDVLTSNTFSVGSWYLLNLGWSGGNGLTLYVNGSVWTFTGTALAPTALVGLGAAQTTWSRDIYGQIADLTVWNRYVDPANQYALLFNGAGYKDSTSLRKFIRGATLPPATAPTPTHRVSLGTLPKDDFTLDSENPITQGLWAYWPIVGRSHLNDYGPRNYPMSYVSTGSAMNQVPFRDGAFGARLYGSGHYYKADADIWPVSEITASFWCWNDATETSSILGNLSTVLGERFNCHCAWSDGKIYFDWGGITDGTSRVIATIPTDYLRNYWRHVLLTAKEGVGMAIWVDGKAINSHSSASTPARTTGTQGASTIGQGDGYNYKGRVAEVAIWNRLLTDAEKVALFRTPLTLRKYRRTGQADMRIRGGVVPVAPATNAVTLAPRTVDIRDASPVAGVQEKFTVNRDDILAQGLASWWQPTQWSSGRNQKDHTRRGGTQEFLAANFAADNIIQDPRYGTAWNLDGSANDRLTSDELDAVGVSWDRDNFSVEALVRPGQTAATTWIATYGNVNNASAPVLNWGLRLEAGGAALFIFRNAANSAWAYSTTNAAVFSTGVWAHVIFWARAAAWGFFVNGETQAKTDTGTVYAASSASNINLKIGSAYDAVTTLHGNSFTGDIALLRVWRRGLLQTDAKRIWQGLQAGRDPLRKRIIDGPTPMQIPDRHWVGEDSDWFTARNWSRAAGGVRGAGVPSCGNPVLFDAERAAYE